MHFRKTAHILKQGSIPVGCISPVLRRMGGGGGSRFGVSLDRDPQKEHGTRHRDPQEKHGTRHRDHPPQRNMGPGSQTGSNIIQKPPFSPLRTE